MRSMATNRNGPTSDLYEMAYDGRTNQVSYVIYQHFILFSTFIMDNERVTVVQI